MPLTVPDVPETPHNVFHLPDPAALLLKLAWEINQLSRSTAPDGKRSASEWLSPAYCGFNCAVTAWHIADWTWQSADQETRQTMAGQLGLSLGSDDKRNFDRFADAICKQSRELKICREVANGSKHMKLRKSDESIVAKAQFSPVVEPLGRFQKGDYMLELAVTDSQGELSASILFAQAFQFWERFLGEFGFIEGRPILGGRRVPPELR
jgi:hypothetical protein